MPVIGTFSAVKDGYAGTIRTLTVINKSPHDRQRPQRSRRRARLPHHGGCRRNRRRLAQDQAGLGGDLPARQARRPRAAAADLGRAARGDRGRRGAAALAAGQERREAERLP